MINENNELTTSLEWTQRFISAFETTVRAIEEHAEFQRQMCVKNNCEKEALIVRFPDSNMSPTLYPEDLYEKYADSNLSMEDIARNVANNIIESHKNVQNFDMNKLSNEYVKEHLTYRIMNAEANQKILETSPVHYVADNDLMLVPYVIVSQQDGEIASFRLTNSLQSEVKMTDSEVHRYAMSNFKSEDFNIKGMNETMAEMLRNDGMPEEYIEQMLPEEEQLYVVTNSEKVQGAVAIAAPGILEEVKEKIGEDNFFIIPSSVHEVLIVPESFVSDPADLHEMCSSVNADSDLIRKEDFLSNNILRYDGQLQELHICNNLEQLQDLTSKVEMTQVFTISRGI